MKKLFERLLVVMIVFTFCGRALAELPSPIFPVGEVQERDLIVESLYRYKVYPYEPIQKIKYIDIEDSKYDTPEQTVFGHFSAMKSGDYDWFLETWTKESRIIMRESDKKRGRSKEFWVKTWDKVLSSREPYITSRIESGDYVFIVYSLKDSNGVVQFEDTLALELAGSFWKISQRLSSDPVGIYWSVPDKRVTQLAR